MGLALPPEALGNDAGPVVGLEPCQQRGASHGRHIVLCAQQLVSADNADVARTIRGADGRDAPVVADIYVESWNRGFTGLMPSRSVTEELVGRWERTLAEPGRSRWWVAQMEGEVVGFTGICPSRDPTVADLGELDTIAVRPARWRHGVGRALMAVAAAHLVADRYDEAILWTLANYERGDAFYRSTGWLPDGAKRDEGRQVRYRRPLR
jgi:GNAT superfamily N-acetyltransferase